MRVLVTGADGYIGSILGPTLLAAGHHVRGLDAGFYREGWLYDDGAQRPACGTKDVRQVSRADLRDLDAVVHLAELSNDPLGQLDPALTHEINHRGTVRLARACRAVGVRRFVYASSCSVYGVASGGAKTEESPVNPQTAYAECKVLVERDLRTLATADFSPTILRNATAFGASPRMRFDLVLNNLAGLAWTTGQIAMVSDGTPWRPLVHVADICEAVACVLAAPAETVHDQVLNVGDDAQNYQVKEIAEIVSETFPGCNLRFGAVSADTRSYRVSFAKIARTLPEFRCRRSARDGAHELREIFGRIGLTRERFESRAFTRLKQLEHLRAHGRVDDRLYWQSPAAVPQPAATEVPA